MDVHQRSLITRASWQLESDHLLPRLEATYSVSFFRAALLLDLDNQKFLTGLFCSPQRAKTSSLREFYSALLFTSNAHFMTSRSCSISALKSWSTPHEWLILCSAVCSQQGLSLFSTLSLRETRALLHKATIIPTRLNRGNIVAHGDVQEMKSRYFALYFKIMVMLFMKISLITII